MASKLQCEICGGKLIGRPNGIFECDSCGMEYSTEWAKQKIQEITGTVRIEGPVEVQGTLKVDNSSRKETLLHRGMMALEEGEWGEAEAFFDEVLDYDSKCAEAYLGLAMAEECCHSEDVFFENYIKPDTNYGKNKNVLYAKKYGNRSLCLKIEQANQEHKAKAEAVIEKNKQDRFVILNIRQERKIAREMICYRSDGIVGICADGNVFTCSESYGSDECKSKYTITDWQGIVAVSIGGKHVLGLRGDGTVLARGDNSFGQCNVTGWKGIKAISTGEDYSIGIRSDGTVVATGHNIMRCCEVNDWNDIVQIVCWSNNSINGIHSETIGLKSDGTLILNEPGYGHTYLDEVKTWKNIISIKKEPWGISGVELKQDGTFVSHVCGRKQLPDDIIEECGTYSLKTDMTITGYSDSDDSLVLASWKNVIEIAGWKEFLCGLHLDGTVSAYVPSEATNKRRFEPKAEQLKTWSNIIAIFFIGLDLYGLQEDGRLVTTCEERQEALSHWKLFDNYRTIESERKEAIERAKIEKRTRIEELSNERNVLQTELSNLSGLFSGKRRKEIQPRLSEIDAELNKLK